MSYRYGIFSLLMGLSSLFTMACSPNTESITQSEQLILARYACIAAAPQPLPGRNPLFLNTDFESAAIAPWAGTYAVEGYSFNMVTNAPRNGSHCAQFNLRPQDRYHNSSRSEIEVWGIAPYKSEVYYFWSFKLPADYVESDDWQVVGQFHDQPDPSLCENWFLYPPNSPPIAYTLKGTAFRLSMSTPGNNVVVIASRNISKGVWHDIITHVFWSPDADAYVETILDGVPLTPFNGTDYRFFRPNMFNRADNFLKIGIYRSPSITTTNTVYFDWVRVGKTLTDVTN